MNASTFWEERKECQSKLCTLAQVALNAPSTQVKVERAFSVFKFILSEQRSHISPSTLHDAMPPR